MTDFAQRRTMMVDTQVRPNEVTSYPVIDAMLTVPREQFVPDALRNVAYAGENIELARNRVELEPRTIGRMLEALDLQSSDLVLHVGCGYGYATALMARIAEAVVATEENPDMAAEAQSRLAAQDIYNVAVTQADLTAGWPGQAPYDAMLVGGAIEALPQAIADQLREGGRIVALFVEGQLGTVRLGHKLDGQINWRNVFNAFAPILPGFKRVSSFAL
ncbi:protein-L-isoaspartate O-methyltransferase [Paracoccus cavernae]|uniref:Protein-L-isoaspartate O-methyltransferase n=1 Tax=Paracoccus cavernae TaxID=1571207 RepID=A0ABT8D9Q8_9RHOB|nr:protein-L-isoaspartate O-methyltransferase [Paracoccus cavernae]